jgi:diguanylate cyclase (GGDEF)-like protein
LRGLVSTVHDSMAQYATPQHLRRHTLYDELTELPNRKAFYEHVQRAIASMKGCTSDRFAVLFVDLDYFNAVSEEFGHVISEKLLAVTARRLELCVHSDDIVARVGGDEFAILLNRINGISDARDAAERIDMLMSRPAIIGELDVRATVRVGIAIGDPRYDRPEDIVRDADAAMYAAKGPRPVRGAVSSVAPPKHREYTLE